MRREIFNRNSRDDVSHTKIVVDMWTELQVEAVEAGPIVTLKRHVYRYMDWKGTEGYCSNAVHRTGLDGLWTT